MRREVFAVLGKKQWLRLGEWVLFYYSSCFLLSMATIQLFDYPATSPSDKLTRSRMIVAAVWVLVLVAAVVVIHANVKTPRVQVAAMAIYISLTLYGLASTAYRLSLGDFNFAHIALWFFALGVWFLVEMRVSQENPPRRWAMTLPIVLLVLGGFARYYYPRIKSSWGGGSPISVVLFLSKDAPVGAGKQLQATLLDESDAGYYIVPAHETKAIFLPRDAVSLVLFADKASDSPFLRTGAP